MGNVFLLRMLFNNKIIVKEGTSYATIKEIKNGHLDFAKKEL